MVIRWGLGAGADIARGLGRQVVITQGPRKLSCEGSHHMRFSGAGSYDSELDAQEAVTRGMALHMRAGGKE